jgi:hypothetical protein
MEFFPSNSKLGEETYKYIQEKRVQLDTCK